MSHDSNSRLYERASELIDELTSHPAGLDKQLDNAIASNDLDELARVVSVCEGVLAQEHFYENNILEANDAY